MRALGGLAPEEEKMWQFFKNIKTGTEFTIWLGVSRFVFVKSGPTTGFCPGTDKIENFAPDCMVKVQVA